MTFVPNFVFYIILQPFVSSFGFLRSFIFGERGEKEESKGLKKKVQERAHTHSAK
jgi:hypothetical protein